MKVFLDANVIFSLAWKENSGLNKLFEIKNTQYVTSKYAQIEVERNLNNADQKLRLGNIIKNIEVITAATSFEKIANITLKEKDLPILNAAIKYQCEYLITGDFRDFGQFYGHSIQGVAILPPREFLTIFSN